MKTSGTQVPRGRLRHREALASVVGDIVRGMKAPTQDVVRELAAKLVAERDIDRLVEIAREDLARLLIIFLALVSHGQYRDRSLRLDRE
jgi:hypothetical protein